MKAWDVSGASHKLSHLIPSQPFQVGTVSPLGDKKTWEVRSSQSFVTFEAIGSFENLH